VSFSKENFVVVVILPQHKRQCNESKTGNSLRYFTPCLEIEKEAYRMTESPHTSIPRTVSGHTQTPIRCVAPPFYTTTYIVRLSLFGGGCIVAIF
jgi:hypothetical protein